MGYSPVQSPCLCSEFRSLSPNNLAPVPPLHGLFVGAALAPRRRHPLVARRLRGPFHRALRRSGRRPRRARARRVEAPSAQRRHRRLQEDPGRAGRRLHEGSSRAGRRDVGGGLHAAPVPARKRRRVGPRRDRPRLGDHTAHQPGDRVLRARGLRSLPLPPDRRPRAGVRLRFGGREAGRARRHLPPRRRPRRAVARRLRSRRRRRRGADRRGRRRRRPHPHGRRRSVRIRKRRASCSTGSWTSIRTDGPISCSGTRTSDRS